MVALTQKISKLFFDNIFYQDKISDLDVNELKNAFFHSVNYGRVFVRSLLFLKESKYLNDNQNINKQLKGYFSKYQQIDQFLESKMSLTLNASQMYCEELNRLTTDLVNVTGVGVTLNFYLTHESHFAFLDHDDNHDVLILHLAGEKEWCVDGEEKRTLCNGDLIYIPRFTSHKAKSLSPYSLHLTIGFHSPDDFREREMSEDLFNEMKEILNLYKLPFTLGEEDLFATGQFRLRSGMTYQCHDIAEKTYLYFPHGVDFKFQYLKREKILGLLDNEQTPVNSNESREWDELKKKLKEKRICY